MVSGNTIGGTIPHTSKMDDGHPSLLMNFENKKENGWTARFVGMVGGIRRRSYSNEKMDTKAKGAIAPDSSKSALLLNQHPFFIAVWWLFWSPLRHGSTHCFDSHFGSSPSLPSSSNRILSLSLPPPLDPRFLLFCFLTLASLRLPGEAKDEYSIMNERQNFR